MHNTVLLFIWTSAETIREPDYFHLPFKVKTLFFFFCQHACFCDCSWPPSSNYTYSLQVVSLPACVMFRLSDSRIFFPPSGIIIQKFKIRLTWKICDFKLIIWANEYTWAKHFSLHFWNFGSGNPELCDSGNAQKIAECLINTLALFCHCIYKIQVVYIYIYKTPNTSLF